LSITFGCFAESAAALTLYVRAEATGANTGSDWDNAFTELQSALSAALPSDQIWVAEGTYSDHVTLGTGLSLYGGFAGDETSGPV
jgi:hypothetical protein